MNDERWTTVDRLLGAALEREPHERAAFLREACGGDETLRLDVESLITHASSGVDVLSTPAVALADRIGSAGTSVLGRQIGPYAIATRLGAGGMGEVYRARDTKLGRDVAIKILPRIFTTDPDRRTRLDREARLLAALNHPHIGAIFGLEEMDGTPALVLELVEGVTLAERIAKGPIPITEALTIARQITDALDAAHEKGITHRDLKPANIKITPDGIVKVLDFGLAKATSGDASSPDLAQSPTVTIGDTHDGVVLGTAPYMSPEQARGKPVDKRTDVWAFGCVLFEMLTGRVAFAGDTVSDTIATILDREPEWSALPAATPIPIRRLLLRCLDKDAKRRLRDIGDARTEIDDVLSGASALAPAPLAQVSASDAWVAAALVNWRRGALVIAVLGVSLVTLWSLRPEPLPVIVLMDSPGLAYDGRTSAAGGTNADDVSDALRDLPVVVHKENTSSGWHREQQVLKQNADLVISHLSSLLDRDSSNEDPAYAARLFDDAQFRLTGIIGYLGGRNPRTRFLVYSRTRFSTEELRAAWVGDVVARFPSLEGRLFTMSMPGGRAKATFRDPGTAEELRALVKAMLALP